MTSHRPSAADDAEFLELRRRFVRDAAARAKELAALLDGAAGGLPAGEPGLRFRGLAHDLRAAGGSYGFPIVSLYAGEAEDTYLDRGSPAVLHEVLRLLEGSLAQAGSLVGA
jgi:hypothetical protein